MKLKEYLEAFKTEVALRPEILEYEVIYARDDEGNGFQRAYNTPSVCQADFDEMLDDVYFEGEDPCDDAFTPNAVCIN